MRRKLALALSIMLCLTLCACTGSSKEMSENVLDIRAKYLGAESLDMTLSLEADSGGRIYDFKVRFTGSDSAGKVEILEPEIIAGVTAEIRDGRAVLGFDGVTFDIGELFGGAESPLEIVPLLLGAWKNSRISSSYAEKQDGEILTVMETAIGSGGCVQRTWFDSEMLPVYAEIESGGRRVVFCTFENTDVN